MYVTFAQFVTEKFVKKLRGEGKDKTEAALERLDRLTKDEVLSVVAQTLGVVHQASNETNKIKRLWFFSAPILPPRQYFVGDQLQNDVQRWLSPPDPSTNQNFVSKARHGGTAAWFLESSVLTGWKAKGSLLWIHGKRTSFELPMSALRL